MPNKVPVYEHAAGARADLNLFRHAYNLSPAASQGWSVGKVVFYAYDGPGAANSVPVYAHGMPTSAGYFTYYDLRKDSQPGWSPGEPAFWVPANPEPGALPVYVTVTGQKSYHYSLQPSMLPQNAARVLARPETPFNAFGQLTYAHNWMSAIDDNASIAQISIPGTHESCARYGGSDAHCQWRSIIDQLNRGIRFLDVRCDYNAPKGGWGCSPVDEDDDPDIYLFARHGPMNQAVTFEEVQAQCIAFLNQNPDEFILMNMQTERVANPDAFRAKFLEQTNPYQKQYWYMENSIPTKKDCKKRIVLIRPYNSSDPGEGWSKGDGSWPGGLEWNGFNQPNNSSSALFQTQNFWNADDGTKKGDEVESFMRSAAVNAQHGQITLNFASYSSGAQSPGVNAAGMNTRLQQFLFEINDQGVETPIAYNSTVGVVAIDFMSNTGSPGSNCLEDLIIEHQAHLQDGYVYVGRAPVLD